MVYMKLRVSKIRCVNYACFPKSDHICTEACLCFLRKHLAWVYSNATICSLLISNVVVDKESCSAVIKKVLCLCSMAMNLYMNPGRDNANETMGCKHKK